MVTPEAGFGGDGEKVPCWNYDECGQMLTVHDMETDRKIPSYQCSVCLRMLVEHDGVEGHSFQGGSYRRSNIRPSCGGCNKARTYDLETDRLREERECVYG
jgi:hypothetical protein